MPQMLPSQGCTELDTASGRRSRLSHHNWLLWTFGFGGGASLFRRSGSASTRKCVTDETFVDVFARRSGSIGTAEVTLGDPCAKRWRQKCEEAEGLDLPRIQSVRPMVGGLISSHSFSYYRADGTTREMPAFHFWPKRVSPTISGNRLTCGNGITRHPHEGDALRNVARNSAQRPGSHGGRVVRGLRAAPTGDRMNRRLRNDFKGNLFLWESRQSRKMYRYTGT